MSTCARKRERERDVTGEKDKGDRATMQRTNEGRGEEKASACLKPKIRRKGRRRRKRRGKRRGRKG